MYAERKHRHRAQDDRKGVVLLLALLVMSSLVVSAAGMSSLILNSLQQTRIVDNALVAYYAAESSVEKTLYDLRTQGTLPTSVTTPVVMDNGAEWTRDITATERVLYMAIPKDSFAEIALHDPDAPISASGIETIRVWWNDDCGGCSILHTTTVGWLPGNITGFETVTNLFPWNSSNPTAQLSVGTGNRLHRLRLRADKGSMTDVEVRAYDGSGTDTDLPGRVKIDAFGRFVDTEQRITVTLPRQVPLSSLFDFVVFSECSLVKGGPISCP